MKRFLRIFLACFSALVIFTFILAVIGVLMLGAALNPPKPDLGSKGVLVLDLTKTITEQQKSDPFASLTGDASDNAPGLYDIVRMLHYAKTDSTVKGLYIKAGYNPNGYATNEELRKAVLDFRSSRKFVIAWGETMDQKSYFVSTAADEVYVHPAGGIDWDGFSVTFLFLKGLFDKLGIEPQVFYAGKYKSATEPFRVTKMTDANRQQTSDFLSDMYAQLLLSTSASRNIDTATLHDLANAGTIRTSSDALHNKLVDGLRYDDQVKSEIISKLGIKAGDKINYISLGKYAESASYKKTSGDKIALIYAQGDIVDGKGQNDEIGSDDFVALLRKARLDDDVKAIVFRVNSPGGSSLASDAIWREVTLAKKVKPVVVSMGDYAASGGYYISCNADSIYTDAATLTGSIGVFSILPNMQEFFNDKLGLTFDVVKTAPYADMLNTYRPLTEQEQHFMQASIDTIYSTFKSRVSNGRNADPAFIDSIAQGHVYTGTRGIQLKLADRIGSLQDAVECAARMAKTKSYYLKEYPEKKSFWESLKSSASYSTSASAQDKILQEKLGTQQYSIFKSLEQLKNYIGNTQTRLPFDITVR